MINSIAQIGKLQWETLGYHDRQEDLLKVLLRIQVTKENISMQ